jgi:hypothetical protein
MAGGTTAAGGQPMLTVALEGPSAQLLADQALVVGDLQFVMDCCKRLLAELDRAPEDRDPVVPQALWSAALTAYGRCFGPAKRLGLTADDVRALPLEGAVLKYHLWLLGERDSLTRHPLDPFETAKVGAGLSPPEEADRRIHGVAILTASRLLVDDTGVRQLGGLASELARQTAARAQSQQDTVLADAQQLGLDSLYKLPRLQPRVPDADTD